MTGRNPKQLFRHKIDVTDKGAVAGYCIVTVSTDKDTVHLEDGHLMEWEEVL